MPPSRWRSSLSWRAVRIRSDLLALVAVAALPACAPARGPVATGANRVPPDMVSVGGFLLDRHEVLAVDYLACVAGGACGELEPRSSTCAYLVLQVDGEVRVPPELPVTCIETAFAAQYCAWRGKRLPSGSEWLRAARGVEGRQYPWGEGEPDCSDVASCPGPGIEGYE